MYVVICYHIRIEHNYTYIRYFNYSSTIILTFLANSDSFSNNKSTHNLVIFPNLKLKKYFNDSKLAKRDELLFSTSDKYSIPIFQVIDFLVRTNAKTIDLPP